MRIYYEGLASSHICNNDYTSTSILGEEGFIRTDLIFNTVGNSHSIPT